MIKDELQEYIIYNEIISNLGFSASVFTVITFIECIGVGSIQINLLIPILAFFTCFVILTIIDLVKRWQ